MWSALKARHVTVDGVSDEYTNAHNAEDRSNSFQHDNDPNAQRSDLTACASAQSKGFPFDVELRKRVMICCNTPKGQPVTKGGHEKGGLATAFCLRDLDILLADVAPAVFALEPRRQHGACQRVRQKTFRSLSVDDSNGCDDCEHEKGGPLRPPFQVSSHLR